MEETGCKFCFGTGLKLIDERSGSAQVNRAAHLRINCGNPVQKHSSHCFQGEQRSSLIGWKRIMRRFVLVNFVFSCSGDEDVQ
jgi:hypothetical protein